MFSWWKLASFLMTIGKVCVLLMGLIFGRSVGLQFSSCSMHTNHMEGWLRHRVQDSTLRLSNSVCGEAGHGCRVHHAKCQAGWSTSWNQDCREKYQSPQICRWHHPYGRKRRGTKEPLDEGERGEWKNWHKTQHSKNEDHGIGSHHVMANRWGNNGNRNGLYFLGLQNHCRWWLQPWN